MKISEAEPVWRVSDISSAAILQTNPGLTLKISQANYAILGLVKMANSTECYSWSFCSGWPNFTNSAAFTAAEIFPADFRQRQKFGGSGYSAAARKSSAAYAVCLSVYCIVWIRLDISSNFFFTSGSLTILVFPRTKHYGERRRRRGPP